MQSGPYCGCCALTPAEIELLWQTTPPRMPIPPPFLSSGMPECSQSQVRSSGLGKAMVLTPFCRSRH